MSEINNGGPACPIEGDAAFGGRFTKHPGMSLRDWFAGQALAGLTTLDADCGPLGVARDAYAHADAMLVARGEKP
jgi:hypothetical protein